MSNTAAPESNRKRKRHREYLIIAFGALFGGIAIGLLALVLINFGADGALSLTGTADWTVADVMPQSGPAPIVGHEMPSSSTPPSPLTTEPLSTSASVGPVVTDPSNSPPASGPSTSVATDDSVVGGFGSGNAPLALGGGGSSGLGGGGGSLSSSGGGGGFMPGGGGIGSTPITTGSNGGSTGSGASSMPSAPSGPSSAGAGSATPLSQPVTTGLTQTPGPSPQPQSSPTPVNNSQPTTSGPTVTGTGGPTGTGSPNSPGPIVTCSGTPCALPIASNANQWQFFDPPVAIGFNYQLNPNTPGQALTFGITEIMPLTSVGTGVYDLWLYDVATNTWVDSSQFNNGNTITIDADPSADTSQAFNVVQFLDGLTQQQDQELGVTDPADGLTQFSLRGIDPSADLNPDDPTDFVTGLLFAGVINGDLIITPLAIDSVTGLPVDPASFVVAVPEPATALLLSPALLAFGWWQRRRQRG